MPDSPPDEEQGNFWDDLEEFFGWFDPDSWLADIGNLISEGLGVLAEPIEALGEGFNNFIEGVGDFFENLIDSLGTWFEDLGQWFDNLVNDLEQWFTNLGNDIGSWFEGVSNDITQFAENFNNTMSNIISYLDPTSERFFLKLAFIPSDGFISEKFNEVKDDFDKKLPIVGTLNELFNSITDEAKKNIISKHPLGLGTPEDVASLILFLLSDNAKWITGSEYIIDGGYSAQ